MSTVRCPAQTSSGPTAGIFDKHIASHHTVRVKRAVTVDLAYTYSRFKQAMTLLIDVFVKHLKPGQLIIIIKRHTKRGDATKRIKMEASKPIGHNQTNNPTRISQTTQRIRMATR